MASARLDAPAAGRGLGYLPAVDGMRALAVAAVVGYHLGVPGLSGGFVGVDVFFVISGYLITGLLARERRETGRVRLGRFWVRRARRLLPALATMVIAMTAAVTLLARDRLPGLRGDLLAAATYTSNWWQIAADQSYFARFSPPSVLQHLWSLAVEEQFYLLWPILLMIGLHRLRRSRALAVLGAATVASAVAMAVLYQPGGDPSRVYFGTGTHAAGLLAGALLALLPPCERLRDRRRVEAIGLIGLTGVLACVGGLDSLEAFTYRGGLALAVVAAAALLFAAADRRTVVARVLGLRPLRWLGVRSYGVYLWHWPLIQVAASLAGEEVPAGWPLRVVLLALTLALAAASYRLVEQPVRRYGLAGSLRRVAGVLRRRPRVRPAWAASGACCGLAAVALAGIAVAPPQDPLEHQLRAGRQALAAQHTPALPTDQPTGLPTGPGAGAGAAGHAGAPGAATGDGPGGPTIGGAEVTAVGDSVLLAAAPELTDRFPGIWIDAEVGRQMWHAGAEVERLRRQGHLRPVLLVDLGTNGRFTTAQIDALLDAAGPHRLVLLVTVTVPDPWQDDVNRALRAAATDHSNVRLVDWHTVVARDPDLLNSDRTHPTEAGGRRYADLVARALHRR